MSTQFNVLVLSYREPCKTNTLPHIEYFYEPVTYIRGRNVLYQRARMRTNKYQYYIFLDDDVKLSLTNYSSTQSSSSAPLRLFEKFLLDYQPAMGVPMYANANKTVSKWRELCKQHDDPPHLVLPTLHFDGCFYAIHSLALPHVYPLQDEYEKESAWLPHRYLCMLAQSMFHGQVVRYLEVIALNQLHKRLKTSKTGYGSKETHAEILMEIKEKAPLPYQNSSFYDMFKSIIAYYKSSRQQIPCLPAFPPCQEIKPYSHFRKGLIGNDNSG